jgi:hypothetical protein
MIEILKNTSPQVALNIYSGTLDDDPSVEISFGNSVVYLSGNKTTPTPLGTSEQWTVSLPLESTDVQQAVEVHWFFHINGDEFEQKFSYDIATPLIMPIDAANELGFSLSPTSSKYRSEKELLSAERLARYTIEQQTNTNFGSETKTVTVFGQATDILVLNENIIAIQQIKENGVVVYSPADDINEFPYTFEPTESGRSIRVADYGDIREYEAEPLVSIAGANTDTSYSSTGLRSSAFRAGSRYEVTGIYGFARVPSDIKQAAVLLINDFLCQDSTWRTKYVQQASMSDFKFTFFKEAFSGTGNAIVDGILSRYQTLDMVVI